MPASFQVPSIFTAIDRVTRPVRRMTNSIMGFARRGSAAIARLDRHFIRFGRTLNSITGGFGVFLGAALAVSVLRGGIDIIADYEQANANLSSILDKTGTEIRALTVDSQRLGATTAFSASEVAGLQTEFAKLGFEIPQILGATEATLALAAATRTELPQAAAQVGAAIRAFGLEASEAARVADVFAASTSKSALDMTKLDVAMSKVAPVAKQFGFSIEDTVALLGTLSNAGFDASTMATSTRSLILNLADANGKLAKQLGKPARNFQEITQAMVTLQKKGIDLADMLDATDKRSVAAFGTLLEGSEKTRQLQDALENAGGFAQRMATTQLDTLRGRLTILNSSYQGFILSLDEGNGAFSETLKSAIDTASAFLLLINQTEFAQEAFAKLDPKIQDNARLLLRVIKVLKVLVIGYVALRAILLVSRVAYTVYSVALGISTALQWKNTIALKGNVIAMKAHVIVTKAAMIAQRALNFVMAANPIGLIIAAVIALGIAIRAIIKNWDEWGASMTLAMGPLGTTISIIQSLRRNWDLITQSFKAGGIVSGIKSIGLAIADAILQPMEQLMRLVKRFTGLDLGIDNAATARKLLQAGLEIQAGQDPTGIVRTNSPVNPEATVAGTNVERQESIEEQRLKIDISDPSGNASIDQDETSSNIDVNLEQAFDFVKADNLGL